MSDEKRAADSVRVGPPELDSPPFVSEGHSALAARGYERVNMPAAPLDAPRSSDALGTSGTCPYCQAAKAGHATLARGCTCSTEPRSDYPLAGLQQAWWIAHEVAENSVHPERQMGAVSVAGKIHDAITKAGGTVPDVDPRSANPKAKP